MAQQKACGDYPDAGEHISNRWHLEDHAHRQHDQYDEVEIVARVQEETESLSQAQKIFSRRRKNYFVSEGCADDERDAWEQDERKRVASLVRVKTGRDEPPDLPEQEGNGQRNRRVDGDFHVERERLHRGCHNQLVVNAG